jgi:hypothetical protein
MAPAAPLNFMARVPASSGLSITRNLDTMSHRSSLLRWKAAASANAAPRQTAWRITSKNCLSTLPMRSSALTPTGESTSRTPPHTCRRAAWRS